VLNRYHLHTTASAIKKLPFLWWVVAIYFTSHLISGLMRRVAFDWSFSIRKLDSQNISPFALN
jgi:hypothetical protein